MQLKELKGHNGGVMSVAISKDNKFIVSGSEDSTVRVWERKSGKKLQELKSHNDRIYSVAIS